MWIKRVEIRGFGCLANRSFDLPEARAVLILADNEHGKSTLAAAIIAGLCGFPKRRLSEELIKQSEVFRPWQGNAYSVSTLLEADGRRLAADRDFAADKFQIRDAVTNADVSAEFREDLTDSLLALPRDDFHRIAVITGKDVHRFESSVGLKSRLAALVEGTEESNAETAIAAIDNARYVLDDRSLKIDTAQARLVQRIEANRTEMSRLDDRIDALGSEAGLLEELQSRQNNLSERLEELDDEYDAARLRETEDELRAAKHATTAGIVLAVLGSVLAAAGSAVGLLRVLPPVIAAVGGIVTAAIAMVGVVLASDSARRKKTILKQLEDLHSGQDLGTASVRSSWTVDSERQETRRRRDDAADRIRELERLVGTTLDNYRSRYPALQEERAKLEAELRKVVRFGTSLDIASKVLREAMDTIRQRWALALNDIVSDILPGLNPDYDTMLFDNNMDITIRHVSADRILQKKDIDSCLSTGAKDQVYLAVRLACAQTLSEREAVPLILDDPFVYFDDTRFESALRFAVERIAPKQQVIILSCHKSRHERFENAGWFRQNVEVVHL